MSKKESAAAVDAVIDAIKRALAKGEKVSLTGFGSFSVKKSQNRAQPTDGEGYQDQSQKRVCVLSW